MWPGFDTAGSSQASLCSMYSSFVMRASAGRVGDTAAALAGGDGDAVAAAAVVVAVASTACAGRAGLPTTLVLGERAAMRAPRPPPAGSGCFSRSCKARARPRAEPRPPAIGKLQWLISLLL